MTPPPSPVPATLSSLDNATAALVRLAAVVADGTEGDVRAILFNAEREVPHQWIEELLLQTYLFAGFPRALNAFREWRRLVPTPSSARRAFDVGEWEDRGKATCRAVYGAMYDKLRTNIDALHTELDAWMIMEGYGKVLSRPDLDLPRRELCIVAACLATGQDRQLHSHLHGSLNVGVSPGVVTAALDALQSVVPRDRIDAARLLFARVVGK